MPKKSKRKVATKKPKQVKPIPSGFRTVTPYLVLNDASGAIEFYKKAFGAKELTRNLTPDGKILNAQIKIGDSIVMLSDEFPMPGSTIKSPSSLGASTFTMHIYSKNVDKLWEQAVAAGAMVGMPLDNMFWGERYGQLVDPFGHHLVSITADQNESQGKRGKAEGGDGDVCSGRAPCRSQGTAQRRWLKNNRQHFS